MKIITVGSCMWPVVKPGRIIEIVETKKVKLGDIVLFNYFGDKFLHRVIKIDCDKITVLDDWGITSPVIINVSDIIGVYPSIFSGGIGYLYHIVVRKIFLFLIRIIGYKFIRN